MQGDSDSTSIYREIRCGRLGNVKAIITKYGLSHRSEWGHGYVLLREAVERRQVDVALFLIEAGAKLNSSKSQIEPTNTPLHFAVVNGDLGVVRSLIVNGANVNAGNRSGETPLHEAVAKKDVEVTELLVKRGAHVTAKSIGGKMPLHIAVERPCFQIVEFLIKNGADVNSGYTIKFCFEGYPPLHSAVKAGSESIVELLLSVGARVNDKINHKTPLHIAAEEGYSQIAEHLVGHGADVNCRSTSKANEGYTPVLFAVEKGSDKIVELLLQSGAKANDKGKGNVTPLHIAAERGFSQIAECLVRHGADVNCRCTLKTNEDCTPLLIAVEKGSMEIVELLLRSGAKADDKGKDNITPLQIAVERGFFHIAECLVGHGADVNCLCTTKASKDYSLLQLAVENERTEVVKVLLLSGAKVNAKGKDGSTPLHIAAMRGYSEIAKHLVGHGAEVNCQCTSTAYEDYTALHFAVKRRNIGIVDLLLHSGSNVNAKGKGGITPLHIAIGKGHSQMAGHQSKRRLHRKFCTPHRISCDPLSTFANINFGEFKTVLEDIFMPVFDDMEGSDVVASLLLKYGANVDTPDHTGKTPLLLAVENGDLKIIEHILEHCPDVNNQSNRSALIAAVSGHEEKYVEITKILLHYGFTVSSENVNNWRLLFTVVEKGYVSIVESLLKYGADVNKLYNYKSLSGLINGGCSPLHVAVRHKQEEVVALLVKFEANVNAVDSSGKSPLFYSCKNADLQNTKLLLSSKTYLKVQPKLLLLSTLGKSVEIIEALLDHGADVNFPDAAVITSLLCFALFVKKEDRCDEDDNIKAGIVKLLVSRGANVNASSNSGMTPLHSAAVNGWAKVVRALLECNANVNSECKNGFTSLHYAAKENHVEVVKTLLEYGAFIDATDECGMTAFHYACKEGHELIVSALLDHGYDINITSNDTGVSSLHQKDNDIWASGGRLSSPCQIISDTLERHIVKMEAANLYVCRENLSLIVKSKYTLRHFQSECKDELASLSCMNVGNSKISWHDILTKSIHDLTSLLDNENMAQSLRSDDYKTKFPLYGSLICSHFRMAERRKKLLEAVNGCCCFLFPELPWECTWEVLSNLTDKDIRNIIHACQPTNVDSPFTKNVVQ